MDFVELENMGKKLFEQFPVVKRIGKRIYQIISYVVSNEKMKAVGNLVRISPEDGYEYYYGYYDKSPWDATDRYIIALKVRKTYKSPAPKEQGEIVLIDTKCDNKVIFVGTTSSWNVQQGCMAQWLGPDFHNRIIYNDYRYGEYCSVIYNVEQKREEKEFPLPIYDVARDGSFALSLDFSRLHRMRPGYGYSNLPEKTNGELCPDKPCIWKLNLHTGEVTELFKYTEMASFEPDESMVGAEHKVNHIMISPNGKRFMVLHRWFKKGRKHTRLVTVNVDKSEMYNLSDDVFVSHCYWKNDEEILSFLRKKGTGDHYYLMKDKTQKYRMYWPELNTDGHCSYSLDSKFIITDTYPNRNRMATVYLCTEEDNCSRQIARVFAPFRYDNDCRCDLHPRWNHKGNRVCIDSVHEGKRAVYVVIMPNYFDDKTTDNVVPKIIHSVWMGRGKKSEVCIKSEKSWHTFCPDYEFIEWNEFNFDVERCDSTYAKEAYKENKWAFVSDYIRLKVLYEYGGIYVDSDMELFKGFDNLLSYSSFIGAESHHTISCGVIGAMPHAKWIGDLLNLYENISFYKTSGEMDKQPITKRVQKYFEDVYMYKWDRVNQNFGDVIVLTTDYFAPLNCYTGVLKVTNNTVSFHHGDNSWKSKSDKVKKKMMQIVTRMIGEENRYKMVKIKNFCYGFRNRLIDMNWISGGKFGSGGGGGGIN